MTDKSHMTHMTHMTHTNNTANKSRQPTSKTKRISAMPVFRTGAFALTALALSASLVQADPFDASWWTLDSGGGESTDGVFSVQGTIGQADASTAMTGGGFELQGGFWVSSITPPCLADFNADEQLDFFDYLDFVTMYAAEDLAADFNADSIVDFFDYLDFVAAYDAGC
ncbi:MAG: hypothetical protein SFZ23_13405 [Planctomycetota bacterium]|nr:hypothetical protein [Planctomycetota bacterium]